MFKNKIIFEIIQNHTESLTKITTHLEKISKIIMSFCERIDKLEALNKEEELKSYHTKYNKLVKEANEGQTKWTEGELRVGKLVLDKDGRVITNIT